MKHFLFKYRNTTIWEVLFMGIVVLLAHKGLYFDAIVVFLVGEVVAVWMEVEINGH